MLVILLNKLLILLFWLSILNVIRITYFVIQSRVLKQRVEMSNVNLILFGVSLAYIITGIIDGITI